MTSVVKAKRDVIENTRLCAEQGWKATFTLATGEIIPSAYITGTDWTNEAVKVERVNERHLPPHIIFLKDVTSVQVNWGT